MKSSVIPEFRNSVIAELFILTKNKLRNFFLIYMRELMWNFGPRRFTSSVTLDNRISFVWIFKNDEESLLLHYATGILSLVEVQKDEEKDFEERKELRLSIFFDYIS